MSGGIDGGAIANSEGKRWARRYDEEAIKTCGSALETARDFELENTAYAKARGKWRVTMGKHASGVEKTDDDDES